MIWVAKTCLRYNSALRIVVSRCAGSSAGTRVHHYRRCGRLARSFPFLDAFTFWRPLRFATGKASPSADGRPLSNINYRNLPPVQKFFVRLILAYRDYGLTALTFHTVSAGVSVLFWWCLVYSKYDVVGWLARMGLVSPFKLLLSNLQIAFGGSSWALAYSIHKGFFPVRILITAFATPLIVRQLRKRHIFTLPPGMRP